LTQTGIAKTQLCRDPVSDGRLPHYGVVFVNSILSIGYGCTTASTTRIAKTQFREQERKRRMTFYRKKLIEVALPLEAINKAAAKENLRGTGRLRFIEVKGRAAGATVASAHIDDGCFVFVHDGEDFTEEQFASLCRFGFSNKRTLHTIGFRGIGFKATFSLGAAVDVLTPSLSVRFHKNRFTQPVWMPNSAPQNLTCVRVPLEDSHRAAELRKNLEDWKQSPSSLLFFRSIRRLTIDGSTVEKRPLGAGPSSDSERVELLSTGTKSSPVVLFQSRAEFAISRRTMA
jgi:hypothetical protein